VVLVRIKFLSDFELLPSFFQVSRCIETFGKLIVGEGIIGVERDRRPEFFLCSFPIPVLPLCEC